MPENTTQTKYKYVEIPKQTKEKIYYTKFFSYNESW